LCFLMAAIGHAACSSSAFKVISAASRLKYKTVRCASGGLRSRSAMIVAASTSACANERLYVGIGIVIWRTAVAEPYISSTSPGVGGRIELLGLYSKKVNRVHNSLRVKDAWASDSLHRAKLKLISSVVVGAH
jgi:hypothetical protein